MKVDFLSSDSRQAEERTRFCAADDLRCNLLLLLRLLLSVSNRNPYLYSCSWTAWNDLRTHAPVCSHLKAVNKIIDKIFHILSSCCEMWFHRGAPVHLRHLITFPCLHRAPTCSTRPAAPGRWVTVSLSLTHRYTAEFSLVHIDFVYTAVMNSFHASRGSSPFSGWWVQRKYSRGRECLLLLSRGCSSAVSSRLQDRAGVSVLTWRVCTDLECLYWPGVSVLTWSVGTDLECLYWPGVSVLTWSVCIDLECRYWPGVSVLTWSVCTDLECLYWPGVSVLTWSVGTDLECLYWPGVSVLTWSVCTDLECLYWPK